MIGTKILERRKSKFNGDLRVVKTWGMGTYIQANGLTQSGGIVETFWNQTLNKIKKSITPKNILILGFGGGTLGKLIQKIWPAAKITGVDIDPVIVELGKKYLNFDGKNVKIVIGDASTFVQKNKTKYDLVIVDLYNGDKFPEKFSTEKYIKFVSRLVKDNGLTVFNRLFYKDKKQEAKDFAEKLKKIFSKVEYYFPQVNLMLLCKL